MLQVIGLFFPAFLSLVVYDCLGKHTSSWTVWDHIKHYGMFTLLDTVTAMLVVRVIKPEIIFSDGWNLNADFLCVVYFAALVVGSIFWGYCVKLFESCFTITIESEKDDDEDEILSNNYEK